MPGTFVPDEGYQIFTTLSEYRQGVDTVIASAQASLDVYDTDLADLGFEEHARHESLRSFLAQNTARRLRVVLSDPLFIQQRAARTQNLMRDFSHQVEIRVLAEKRDADVFIYSDVGVCLYRPQHDHAKSVLTSEDLSRYRLLAGRFAQMFDVAEQSVSSAVLGL
ncbi:hypothetical protein CAP31_13940 [Sulfuriferula sp. AH1]|uniref:DUF7931 domain-containing protein n=1 Tax=Sulfuriferula sp. AH1 TaxID=1985873 RepID=UPI000B3B100F|nr:hypothetical protein [Sulfuriferula sp. AH1]ARU32671.1 hypothetical protein CAP31_13940 [Sulfuriferula sp. AH1]